MQTRSKFRAARRIQCWWRRALAFPRCPITLEHLHRATAITVGSHIFDADALRAYIRSSGDTRHPLTRTDISPRTLQRLGLGTDDIPRRASEMTHDELVDYIQSEIVANARQICDIIAGHRTLDLERSRGYFEGMVDGVVDLVRMNALSEVQECMERCLAILREHPLPRDHIPAFLIVRRFFMELSIVH